MTYRIRIESGPLAGRYVTAEAPSEWAAMSLFVDALGDVLGRGFAVPLMPGTADLFGDAPQVETITLSEAMRLLSEHAK